MFVWGGKHSLVFFTGGRSGLVVRVSLSARMAGGRNGTHRGDSGLSFAVALVRGRVTVWGCRGGDRHSGNAHTRRSTASVKPSLAPDCREVGEACCWFYGCRGSSLSQKLFRGAVLNLLDDCSVELSPK